MSVNNTNTNVELNQDIYMSKKDANLNVNNGSTERQDKDSDKISRKKLDKSVGIVNKILFKDNTHLKFEVHDITKDIMVQIIDDKTGEVLKEIPPKKIIDMVANMCEALGIFVDKRR